MLSDPVKLPNSFKFGNDFELDVRGYELRSAGCPLKLKPIPMDLLLLLVQHRGELITREQIVERIGGKESFSIPITVSMEPSARSARSYEMILNVRDLCKP